MATPPLGRRRARPEKSLLARTWGIYAGVLLVGVAIAAWALRPKPVEAKPLTGYVTEMELLGKEYRKFYGKDMQAPDAENGFRNATEMMQKHDYPAAAAVLEQVAKEAALPVVYNDLGVLYASMNDRGRAVNSFREALSRDIEYRSVRENLNRLRQYLNDSAEPVTHEIEPNNTLLAPNLIALNKPVAGEIGEDRDQDVFKVNSPPSPRDVLVVEIENHSDTLILGLRVYDTNLAPTQLGRVLSQAGEALTISLSPAVNTSLYLQIWGVNDTGGKYSLTVKAPHTQDAYEPNDDVFNSYRLTLGATIEAGIMDAQDTDVFSFVAPRDGFVEIDIVNKSATLVPALTMYGPDQRNSGFGPYIRIPGSNLKHRMPVQANQIYYIQVWAQNSSAGAYTLTVN